MAFPTRRSRTRSRRWAPPARSSAVRQSSRDRQSAEFFKLPVEKKSELAWRDPRANRGFVQVGRERVTQSADAEEIKQLREKAPDYKESMEIGRDWDKTYKNYWPQETDAPGFKRTMLDFFQTCHDLHVLVMRSIALGLKLEETFFDKKIGEQYHNLRLLSYPPVQHSALSEEGQARAGAHSGKNYLDSPRSLAEEVQ